MSALGRLKRAVRTAIGLNGGIDGAGATTGRARQTTGGWNNLNDSALPTLDSAVALDEVAIANGHRPEILCAMAGELGQVVIALPHAIGSHDDLVLQMAEATGDFGDVANALTRALANHKIEGGEDAIIGAQIDEALQALTRLRALVNAAAKGSEDDR